ncbi:MAG: acetoacetate metabolism regulatory protein AtoC [Gemmatimonadota bacterium]|nr:MAG: acetoacetate metabolism regulatory protein AtoC [Gemmatimonadota bacterium]
MSDQVLVIDDEAGVRTTLRRALEEEGFCVATADSAHAGLRRAGVDRPDVAVVDLKLGDASGLDVLRDLKVLSPTTVTIMISAYGDVQDVVQAMKLGADDYVQKPYDLDEMVRCVTQTLHASRIREQFGKGGRATVQSDGLDRILGESESIEDIRETVRKVVRSGAQTVLILGETGTGKELVARALHSESSRAKHPFVKVNCSAIPDSLFESELFGHERGTFTDAQETRLGLAEVANGGTLFLDEIGDAGAGAQAKLLTFIEDHRFRRLGGREDIDVDVRIVAATNKDLDEACDSGEFRSDLLHRLKVISLTLPSLREREGDISHLALRFVEEFCAQTAKPAMTLSEESLECLESYSWPGNVRELRNAMERVVLLEECDSIEPEHLSQKLRGSSSLGRARGLVSRSARPLADVEREHIYRVVDETEGNRTRAADILGITRQTLINKLKSYGHPSVVEREPVDADTA